MEHYNLPLICTLGSIHTYIHTYIHTSIHTCIHTCIHVYVYTCMFVCMYVCMFLRMFAYMHTCIHVFHTYFSSPGGENQLTCFWAENHPHRRHRHHHIVFICARFWFLDCQAGIAIGLEIVRQIHIAR